MASERVAVEHALVAFYLTEGENGAGPVRYLDASRKALEEALGELSGEDALQTLARACDGPESVAKVLDIGWSSRWPDHMAPGFFRFLILTCAVVAEADAAKTKEFGQNLAAIFRCENIFQSRSALPGLWVKLAGWCRLARSKQAPIREFLLPSVQPTGRRLGNVKHLRTTYEVAFPTWRDLAHLRVVLDRNTELKELSSEPLGAARFLCPVVRRDDGFSEPMRIAGAEFHKLYQSRATLLRLHRFWSAIARVTQEGKRTREGQEREAVFELHLGAGLEDAEAALYVRDANSFVTVPDEAIEGPASAVFEQTDAWLRSLRGRFRSRVLLSALEAGIVLLREAGFSRWTSDPDALSNASRYLLLISTRARKLNTTGQMIGQLTSGWTLRGPLHGPTLEQALQLLGLRGPKLVPAREIEVLGGVRCGGSYLGRPCFLPSVLVSSFASLSLHSTTQSSTAAVLVREERSKFRIASERPLDGRFRLRLEEQVADLDPLVSERPISFVADAAEHQGISGPNAQRWASVVEAQPPNRLGPTACEATTWSPAIHGQEYSGVMEDLEEAVYAGGASGWGEADLLELISRVVPADGPSYWDVLRSLHESGIIYPTIGVRYRVRRWWLRPPSLLRATDGGSQTWIFLGSRSAVLRQRFVATATAAGAHVQYGMAPSVFCPPPLRAHGGADAIEHELQFPVQSASSVLCATSHIALASLPNDPSRHAEVSAWNWSTGRFEQAPPFGNSGVSLIRHRRESADRPDLYTVQGGSDPRSVWVGLSRTAAILEAHKRARKPLFARRGNWLIRLSSDGHLPVEVAMCASMRRGAASGPYRDGEHWSYAYPLDPRTLEWLKSAYGHWIVAPDARHPSSTPGRYEPSSIGRARSRGQDRDIRLCAMRY